MKILMVIDQFFDANNGMTISARRFASVLEKHGHEVRVVCTANGQSRKDFYAYILPEQRIPVFNGLVNSQGMKFAKPEDDVLKEAIAWADVVHILLPFALSRRSIMLAREMGKPYTAAFHVQPENITSSAHLGNAALINRELYRWFNSYIFKYCGHVHCPSRFIADELKKYGYSSKLHVISNGIDPAFHYMRLPKRPELAGKFVILTVGRLSIEKRQNVLIDAAALSRHEKDIQLVLAGQGPRKKALTGRGAKLTNAPIINFYEKEELLELIAMSDLYVHAANAEIEAMSCMEAFACGLVPVIADSRKSATPQFALDERSLFRVNDAADLAKKIDYWIEHREERERMGVLYGELAKKYDLDSCVRQAEEMFEAAIKEGRGIAS